MPLRAFLNALGRDSIKIEPHIDWRGRMGVFVLVDRFNRKRGHWSYPGCCNCETCKARDAAYRSLKSRPEKVRRFVEDVLMPDGWWPSAVGQDDRLELVRHGYSDRPLVLPATTSDPKWETRARAALRRATAARHFGER